METVAIFVDVQKVSIRLNGQQVSTSQLADLKPGRLGMLVSVERVAPPPKWISATLAFLCYPTRRSSYAGFTSGHHSDP